MRIVYIACPKETFSGGPELAHQLCHELNQIGQSAKMCYYTTTGEIEPWDTAGTDYECYQTTSAASLAEVDQTSNIVILPETATAMLEMFVKCRLHIWWMSVDNYYISTTDAQQDKFKQFINANDSIFHFVQSYYAYLHCRDTLLIPEDQIFYLTDYINDVYMGRLLPPDVRKDYIFYNPKKGFEIMEKLMEKYPGYQWIPVINMTPAQIAQAFSVGKIYLDFGNHPGKDRIPREAAARGCCVITNREGAAGNDKDIPIPDEYKFGNVLSSFPAIIQAINEILADYTGAFRKYGKYRKQIRVEKQQFQNEALSLCRLLELSQD